MVWWLRSGYVQRVRALAPHRLVGRDGDLARLAEWCTGSEVRVRWPADRDLLTWFVLHPPPDTWVVSCFDADPVTALIDQFYAIGGVPQADLDPDRGQHLRQVSSAAAEIARAHGQRLVVVLEALTVPDEIAGMRLILAGDDPDDAPPPPPIDDEDRLLDEPGGLMRVLAGICAVQDVLARQSDVDDADLELAVALARRREHLRERPVPARLAPLWARLGNLTRALTLANEPPDAEAAWNARIGVAQAVAATDDTALAEAIARHADGGEDAEFVDEAIAEALLAGPGPGWPVTQDPHPELDALYATGEVVVTRTDPYERVKALARVAGALALGGAPDRAAGLAAEADAVARSEFPHRLPLVAAQYRAEALDIVARTWAALGDRDRAEAAVRAVTVAPFTMSTGNRRFPIDPYDRVEALVRVAATVADDGTRAADLLEQAHEAADGDDRPGFRAEALAIVAEAWLALGDRTRAEAAARAATPPVSPSDTPPEPTVASPFPPVADPRQRVAALAEAVRATAAPTRADLVAEIDAVIRAMPTDLGLGLDRAGAVGSAVGALVAVGDLDRADAVAGVIGDPAVRAHQGGQVELVQTLAVLARAWAEFGDHDRAEKHAADAEALARTVTRADQRAGALAQAAIARAAVDGPRAAVALADEAVEVATGIPSDHWRGHGIAAVLPALLATGDHQRAVALALAVPHPDRLGVERVLVTTVTALADAGDRPRARALAHALTTPNARRHALLAVGDRDTAEADARAEPDPQARARAMAEVAEAVAADDPARAEALARAVTSTEPRAAALAAVAAVVPPDRARRLLVEALALGYPPTSIDAR